MHGHLRSPELPIYGAKTLGVREGRLEMHGKPVESPWTRLHATAEAGATMIVLEREVDWSVGNKIVIASTGLRHSQEENEEKEIAAIEQVDGTTEITLTEPLEFLHLGVSETYENNGQSYTVQYRAEVGLLTRNIVFRGSEDQSWNIKIDRCEEGFDTGMFAKQTCFQGRFGEEIGSDQFGGSIMIHPKVRDSGVAVAHIENVEVTYAGQAFRLGRYPIHFHLLGDASDSYVRRCSLHRTFNRAVTIHGTNNLLVEHNVLYNVMGGAIFIEDGIEENNIVQFNLLVFVRQSTSLLTEDVTPAGIWVTHPNNIVQHNAMAGGTHFGVWYRMLEHPDGPSFDPNICPQKEVMGTFKNNTVHSQGWFGIWIFQTYRPQEGGSCHSSRNPKAAKFYSLTAWHCEKGAEWVEGGAIQFHDFVLSANEVTGIDVKLIEGTEWGKENRSALIKDSVIIGHTDFSESNYETTLGITLPFAPGLWLDGIHFFNINRGGAAFGITTITGTCTHLCGGWYYYMEDLSFESVARKIAWGYEYHGVLLDLDGTLTGVAGRTVVPHSALYEDALCQTTTDSSLGASDATPSMICDSSVSFFRFAFNNPNPTSLEFKDVILENELGSSSGPWAKKRLTHKEGWMILLREGLEYTMSFKDAPPFTNISYDATMYAVRPNTYVIIKHVLGQQPDRIAMVNGLDERVGKTSPLNASSPNLAWHFDYESNNFSYIISGERSSRRKRASLGMNDDDFKHVDIAFSLYRCYYLDCEAPVDSTTLSSVRELPEDHTRVTNASAQYDCFKYEGESATNNDVTVPEDCWVVIATDLVINKMTVYGNVVFDRDMDLVFSATHIITLGRLIAGFNSQEVHSSFLKITLRGDYSTEEVVLSNGISCGSKTICCVGLCEFHGRNQANTKWVRLADTASVNTHTLTLASSVNWAAGNKIVVTTTGFSANQTEEHVIDTVSEDGLTITTIEELRYTHKHVTAQHGDWDVSLTAEVGLLTRNIVIEGEDNDLTEVQSFGARVLTVTNGNHNARSSFTNVEFVRTGQEGWYDSEDPRYSLAWLNGGGGSEISECSIHGGYSSAIGVFGTSGVNIRNNVIHEAVNEGLVIEGSQHNITGNLVASVRFPGAYKGRFETANFAYPAAFNLERASFINLKDNSVAGAERVGYKVRGQPCTDTEDAWSGNVVHAALHGIQQISDLDLCSLVQGFGAWKCWDFAIYHQTTASMIIRHTWVADSTIGLMPLIYSPPALSHEYVDKYCRVEHSLFVARADTTECLSDMDETTDDNLILRRIAGVNKKAKIPPSGGRVCMILPLFASGRNGAPFKSWAVNMNYPALHGQMEVLNVTFANVGKHCNEKRDVIFFTNTENEDAFHPTHLSQIQTYGVEEESFAFLDRPDEGKINPSDCGDMMCDAKLKILIKDLDGSLLGEAGSITSETEYGWGDQTLGVGDFRIPSAMITFPNGSRMDPNSLAPHKGLVRDSGCSEMADWQGYKCSGSNAPNYEMLVVESMDEDTETRRLTPLGMLSGGYIDLTNGPQDHGWCAGYTCQRRISTLYTIVSTGRQYQMYFTSTPPQHFKLHLLNSTEDSMLTVAIWIPNPMKLEVYSDDVLVEPTNHYVENGIEKLRRPSYSGEFIPDYNTANNGDNFLDLDTRLLYVAIGGPVGIVEVRTRPSVVLTFDFAAVSIDEFFEENLVNNLALLLGVSSENIRIVDVVRESRRKRSTSGQTTVVIGTDTPIQTRNDVINLVQGDDFTVLGATEGEVTGVRISGTLTSETIAEMDRALANGEYVPAYADIGVPTAISLVTSPSGVELSTLTEPLQVQLVDANGALVTSTTDERNVTVTLDTSVTGADSNAILSGTVLELHFTNGIATFGDLVISHSGNYKLIFTPSTNISGDESAVFTISQRTVSAAVTSQSSDYVTAADNDIELTYQLQDGNGARLTNVAHKGYTWKLDMTLESQPGVTASLGGTTTFTFDASNGELTTTGLTISGTRAYFKYNLKARVYTDPSSDYDFNAGITTIQIYPASSSDYTHVHPVRKEIKMKFGDAYDTVLGGNDVESLQTALNNYFISEYPEHFYTDFVAQRSADGTLEVTTTIYAETESHVDYFVGNVSADDNINYNGAPLTLASDCALSVDGACSEDVNNAEPQATALDNTTAIIIFSALGGSVLVAALIVSLSCYYTRGAQNRKVSALQCMNNSQSSPDSSGRLVDTPDSFRPSSNAEWARRTPDSMRMTPVV